MSNPLDDAHEKLNKALAVVKLLKSEGCDNVKMIQARKVVATTLDELLEVAAKQDTDLKPL